MILVVDVGNTNITCGVYEGEALKATFRITTKIPRTSNDVHQYVGVAGCFY